MSYEAWGDGDDDHWSSEQAHELASTAFVAGAQACREMMARFVEQGGDAVTAASIRANWCPSWGGDPGPIDRGAAIPLSDDYSWAEGATPSDSSTASRTLASDAPGSPPTGGSTSTAG